MLSFRFSSEVGLSTQLLSETAECSEAESREGVEGIPRGLPRSQSERLLAVCKEHVIQEKELQEKYHDSLFSTLEKIMKVSQSNQLKTLKENRQRERDEAMRKIQARRHEQVNDTRYNSFIIIKINTTNIVIGEAAR